MPPAVVNRTVCSPSAVVQQDRIVIGGSVAGLFLRKFAPLDAAVGGGVVDEAVQDDNVDLHGRGHRPIGEESAPTSGGL
ncbi:hypothetical protein [Rhodococcus pyridinivorans]|uniref:hypothetical protein n=1 Tax=Rhodococcus pyridinivorans TaxID=103816 RepID=UPI002284785E|nr:hypothetical protein [Rhodococcus pyridinivorans]WAL49273.1 hypothetical protein OQN32_26745 [Rhodococcus pyridinivorans]